jgi:ABC-type Fe3+-hydroxamate transport system substrate-binding protein
LNKIAQKLIILISFSISLNIHATNNERIKFKRIVSTNLASDEILLGLLTEEEAKNHVIRLSSLSESGEYSNITREAKKFKKFGGEPESIAKIEPDLIIFASFNNKKLITSLEKFSIHTHKLTEFQSLDDISSNIKDIANLIGTPSRAEKLIKKIRQSIKFKSKIQYKTLIYQKNLYVNAKGTIYSDLLQSLSLINIHDLHNLKGWPKVTSEYIATLKPDILIIPTIDGTRSSAKEIIKEIGANPIWRNLPAVRQKKYIFLKMSELNATSHWIEHAAKDIIEQLKDLEE